MSNCGTPKSGGDKLAILNGTKPVDKKLLYYVCVKNNRLAEHKTVAIDKIFFVDLI